MPSQKTPFVGRRKRRVGNLRYWNSKSAERERSAEKLLGSRERVGKQVLSVLFWKHRDSVLGGRWTYEIWKHRDRRNGVRT